MRRTLVAILQLSVIASVHTASGDLDLDFGTAGRVTRDFFGNRDEARALAVQADGRIVVAGFARSGTDQGPDSALEDFVLERYHTDGTPDDSFGDEGTVVTDIGGEDRASAVAIQPNGQILAAGGTCEPPNFDICDFALVRYNSDGTPDSRFGDDGQVRTRFPGLVTLAFGLAVQRDGKIVVSGWAFDGVGFDFALARYLRNGTLDSSFGNDGVVTTDLAAGNDFSMDVVVLRTGKIVASGTAFTGTTYDFALVQYASDGTLDRTFGHGGKVVTDFDSSEEEIWDLALQADGRMVALGETFSATGVAFALARYNPDGTPDTRFGSQGLVTTDFGSGNAQGEGLAIQPDGKILAAGGGVFGAATDFQLARYNSDGDLDVSFGVGGMLTTDFFGGRDRALDVALHPSGEIALAGWAFNGVSRDFALARYVPR